MGPLPQQTDVTFLPAHRPVQESDLLDFACFMSWTRLWESGARERLLFKLPCSRPSVNVCSKGEMGRTLGWAVTFRAAQPPEKGGSGTILAHFCCTLCCLSALAWVLKTKEWTSHGPITQPATPPWCWPQGDWLAVPHFSLLPFPTHYMGHFSRRRQWKNQGFGVSVLTPLPSNPLRASGNAHLAP